MIVAYLLLKKRRVFILFASSLQTITQIRIKLEGGLYFAIQPIICMNE